MRIVTPALFLTVLVGPIKADELQTWNETSLTLLRSKRLEWSAGGVLRFRQSVGDLYDRRAGTQVAFRLTDRFSLVGAYLFRNQDRNASSVNENRLTAGVGYPLINGSFRINGSTLYERHLVATEPHFNRFRQRFEISLPGKALSPWVHQDFTFRQDSGFIRSRSRLGFRWRQRSAYEVKVAYQFESISKGSAWAPRHSIYTEVSLDKAIWNRE